MEYAPELGSNIIACPFCERRLRVPTYEPDNPIKKMFFVFAKPVGVSLPNQEPLRPEIVSKRALREKSSETKDSENRHEATK